MLEYNCFTMLYLFLLYNEVNQLLTRIPSHLDHASPNPTQLGHRRAPSWIPCALQQLPTSICFTYSSLYTSMLHSQFVPLSPSHVFYFSLGSTSYVVNPNKKKWPLWPGLEIQMASMVAKMVKNMPAMRETQGDSSRERTKTNVSLTWCWMDSGVKGG